MQWLLIPKHRTTAPQNGTYRNWKALLAQEGGHQCVYCALPEARFGGQYNFHVDHFEPKVLAPRRVNDWANLFYACAICNVFKGDDWPNPAGPFGYPNPAAIDYETVFIRLAQGEIRGVTSNARYMVERLYLNRPQLLLERREAVLRQRLQQLNDTIQAIRTNLPRSSRGNPSAGKVLLKMIATQARIQTLLNDLWAVQPYAPADVRRPARGR